MTEAEALAIAARYLAGHHCDQCGGQWITGKSITMVFHRCRRTRPVGIRTWDRETDTRRWAASLLGAAFADAVEAQDLALLLGEEEE